MFYHDQSLHEHIFLFKKLQLILFTYQLQDAKQDGELLQGREGVRVRIVEREDPVPAEVHGLRERNQKTRSHHQGNR